MFTFFYRNGRPSESGQPVFFTMTGDNFVFGPSPDTSYSAELLYYAAPDFLSDSNTSNTFLVTAPDALLYASLDPVWQIILKLSDLYVLFCYFLCHP